MFILVRVQSVGRHLHQVEQSSARHLGEGGAERVESDTSYVQHHPLTRLGENIPVEVHRRKVPHSSSEQTNPNSKRATLQLSQINLNIMLARKFPPYKKKTVACHTIAGDRIDMVEYSIETPNAKNAIISASKMQPL